MTITALETIVERLFARSYIPLDQRGEESMTGCKCRISRRWLLILAFSTIARWSVATENVAWDQYLSHESYSVTQSTGDISKLNPGRKRDRAHHLETIWGVEPALDSPRCCYRMAWKFHGLIIPLLHCLDLAAARESHNALRVLWCKAISAGDAHSRAHDDDWTYDMLPDYVRWLILRFIPLAWYPRWHHAVIETRTVFLNTIIQQEMARQPSTTPIRIIALGAGYDVRYCRILSTQWNANPWRAVEVWELDMPNVTQAKRTMLARLQQRRKISRNQTVVLPQLLSVNLNDVENSVWSVLDRIVSPSHRSPFIPSHPDIDRRWHTIFVCEGVLMYLDDGVPQKLWQAMRAAIEASGGTASFCFVDRLPLDGDDADTARDALRQAGWELSHWYVKNGSARHMGCATCKL